MNEDDSIISHQRYWDIFTIDRGKKNGLKIVMNDRKKKKLNVSFACIIDPAL